MAQIKENVDRTETEKFARLATEWWDPNGKCKPLHDLNPARLQFILDRTGFIENKTVLDVGTGAGILSESLARRGAKVTGIDAGEEVIHAAKAHAILENIPFELLQYFVTTAEAHAKLHPKSYDIVTCMELLEHVPCPITLISACAKLVKPGGQLFFSTLNRTPKSFLFAIVGAEYVLNLLPKHTHQYSKFIRPSELAEGLRNVSDDLKVNLILKEVKGLHYNPFTRQASLTSNVDVNYLAFVEA